MPNYISPLPPAVVVTAAEPVTAGEQAKQFKVRLVVSVEGRRQNLDINVNVYEKRPAFSMQGWRELTNLDFAAETRLRTAAEAAYRGEFKGPYVISGEPSSKGVSLAV